jgi:ABC-type cobalamin transport system permease subunit
MVLAYAQKSGSNVSDVTFVTVGLGIIAAACALVCAVIALAVRRRHRQHEVILVAAIFWGVISAASVGKALMDQAKWSDESILRLQSGYYTEAQAQADAPRLPLVSWTILAGAYGALLIWSSSAPAPPRGTG